jgi:pyruvate dehydrogenase E2 component (dihydrolipoamide acetyltransferase)
MATKVYMEALSPTMEEGKLTAWLKKEGDQVSEGDVLAEVETDKATMELVARGSGVLRKTLIGDGDTADVGTVIAVIAGEDEDVSDLGGEDAAVEQAPTRAEAEEATEPEPEAAESEEEADAAEGAAEVAAAGRTEPQRAGGGSREAGSSGEEAAPAAHERGGDGAGRVRASPLARRLAEEGGVNLGGVRGSGPGGRIVKRDIEAALGEAGAEPSADAPRRTAAPAAAAGAQGDAYRDLPLSPMRKTIARRLGESLGPVPHFFLTVEVDMTEMQRLRARMNEALADEGVKVSLNDLLIRSVGGALRRHPMVNASWTGEAIRQFDEVHIGVAVAVEEGLITPVVRNADRKGVAEIAREVRELAGRARDKKLKPEEYTGSTFSISNLGMFGIEEFTAVINPPEAAILAVGAVTDRVVVVDGEMVVRSRMRVTLSCDHRVIDGATGAEFLRTLRQFLEDPLMMIA